MGYINYDNNIITVDAILTKKGRELLAAGRSLNITKFALADDEIDYSLWNTSHPSGSDYYGVAIEALPLIEAVPDETKLMKYKLVSLTQGNTIIAIVQVPNSAITFANVTSGASVAVIRPTTVNGTNDVLGYSFVINNPEHFQKIRITQPVADSGIPVSTTVSGGEGGEGTKTTTTVFEVTTRGMKGKSLTLVGKEIEITPVSGNGSDAYDRGLLGNQSAVSLQSVIAVAGREIGGTTSVQVTIGWTSTRVTA